MKRKVICIFVATMLALSMSACAKKEETTTTAAPTTAEATTAAPTEAATTEATTTVAGETTTAAETTAAPVAAKGEIAPGYSPDYSNPYTFSFYYNYDWWTVKKWGDDATSAYLKTKFNTQVDISKPDSDAAAKMNLMIASGELPDSILMERDATYLRMIDLGYFLDLAPFQAVNKNYDNGVLASTQEFLKIKGKLYGIPNWVRKGATGGNNCWIVEQNLYKQAGSPPLKTFEDLYNYAKTVKDTIPTTADGKTVVPMDFDNAGGDCFNLISGIYRSMGGYQVTSWYTPFEGKLQLAMRSPLYKAAVMEANKWYREGLIPSTVLSDTADQMTEKLTGGQVALMYYDHSKEDTTHFRTILRETYPGDSYEMVTDPVYPPSAGVAKTWGDQVGTLGWNVNVITNKAKDPQRIFDLWTYFYTKEGCIEMMYGPQGDLWDTLDANGNPVLKTAEQDLTQAEKDRLGLWVWNHVGHADIVDSTKFAVNAGLPAEKRSWVITNQSDYLTPTMGITDELSALFDAIDPLSDTGVNKQLTEDTLKATMVKIISADTEASALQQYDELLKFCDDNGMKDVEAVGNDKYQFNLSQQGGSIFPK